jgi:hypothetical protein
MLARTAVLVVFAALFASGCASVNLPSLRYPPKESTSAVDTVEKTKSLSDAVEKASKVRGEYMEVHAELVKDTERPALITALAAIGGAAAAASNLHRDALVGFGSVATLMATASGLYKPQDQRGNYYRAATALRCMIRETHALMDQIEVVAHVDVDQRFAALTGPTSEVKVAAVLVARELKGNDQEELEAMRKLVGAHAIFTDHVVALHSKLREAQAKIVTTADYDKISKDFADRIVAERERAKLIANPAAKPATTDQKALNARTLATTDRVQIAIRLMLAEAVKYPGALDTCMVSAGFGDT